MKRTKTLTIITFYLLCLILLLLPDNVHNQEVDYTDILYCGAHVRRLESDSSRKRSSLKILCVK